MFYAKKIISRLFFPVPLSLELLLLGLFLLWCTRRQRAGKLLVTCGALLLAGLSNSHISTVLVRPLERCFPPLAVGPASAGNPPATYIVVLGASAADDPGVPISSRISPTLMVRLVEGVLVHREVADSKLILSGGKDSADGMTRVAEALGVDDQDILRLSEPADTEAEAAQVSSLAGAHRLILVTSASHMPRAMGLFRKRGLQPIPAPTDYLAPQHRTELDDFVPDAYKLYRSQVAIYEFLGLAWADLRGKL